MESVSESRFFFRPFTRLWQLKERKAAERAGRDSDTTQALWHTSKTITVIIIISFMLWQSK